MNPELIQNIRQAYQCRFNVQPTGVAYAPGRVEILGNHTDYNDGFVLSAATDAGVAVALSPRGGPQAVLRSLDLNEEVTLSLPVTAPLVRPLWANYMAGVAHMLGPKAVQGFQAVMAGDIPMGSGLSSSAALEVATGLALCALNGIQLTPLALARACQKAEHEYAGAKCGLLDQISSLFGQDHALVFTDFRSLKVASLPLPGDLCFLVANTRVKHSLVDGEYNERRETCEKAAAYFNRTLVHPVKALRDVSLDEWTAHAPRMPAILAKRAAHVIGENQRVLAARSLLANGQLKEFGRLMFDSHRSSQTNFENSCPELDFIVDTAETMPVVFGARLSGGGFGGSAVLLVRPADAPTVGQALAEQYQQRYGTPCDIQRITPSAGARLL